ncbi:hypothetical protein ABZ871_39685 [Streptomyces populi]
MPVATDGHASPDGDGLMHRPGPDPRRTGTEPGTGTGTGTGTRIPPHRALTK